MTLKEVELKHCYDSDEDNILNDFYIPVLQKSFKYYRLAGFFRSSALAVAARGIQGLLQNDGEMKLIASANLSKKDVDAINDGLENPEEVIERTMIEDLNEIEDEFARDHVSALGWMIAKKKLEIKIAIVTDNSGMPLDTESIEKRGIFHQKVGIFEDKERNRISFSGSDNESASAWEKNIEEFKVFRDWEEGERSYLKSDFNRFLKFWQGNAIRTKIIDVPTAVKQKLITLAPTDINNLDLHRWNKKSSNKMKPIVLYKYQSEAIANWFKNNKHGIFEMATGTGKTYTALGCIQEIFKQYERIGVIIACPYNHLIQQWKREIKRFGIVNDILIADSSNSDWKNELSDCFVDVSLGYKDKIIILTTHRTFSSNDFIDIIKSVKTLDIFLIGDEVHGLGAEKGRTGLIENYNLRLGLSATPKRWFDLIGTDEIYHYFKGVVYELGLEKAINTINPSTGKTFLTPYRYIPKFVSLTTLELSEYEKKTKLILWNYSKTKDDIEKEKLIENLIFQRANIIKNAQGKFQELERILDELGNDLTLTIIYCIPQQIDSVMEILKKRRITAHRFTMEEGTNSDIKYGNLSEREYLLKQFANQEYQVLVAMKCLDEGVDIPPAETAILLASSGNPREFIQRIGRIIRRYEEKEEATIFDVIVSPSTKNMDKELKDLELKIFEKELARYEEIAKIAINNADALEIIYKVKTSLR
jgi:superfamily II DNA or RNA helicase